MTTFHAFRKGIQLCHAHFSLLWLETGWRTAQFFLSLGFALLAGYTLVEAVGLSDFEFKSLENSSLAILKALVRILQKNDTLILKTILLTLGFIVVMWLLLASFFQAGILGLLTREEDNREIEERDVFDSGMVLALQGFCRKAVQLFPSFFLINLCILLFSFAGSVSFVVILRYSLRLGEASSKLWLILTCGLGLAVLLVILGVAVQFLEISKLCVAQHKCSLWSAWNRSAEFFFVNLRPMGAILSLTHTLNFMIICSAMGFLGLIGSVLGAEFFGAFCFLSLLVYLGYGLLKNYLFLIKSSSLLTLIGR
jgi:hypothetical protein